MNNKDELLSPTFPEKRLRDPRTIIAVRAIVEKLGLERYLAKGIDTLAFTNSAVEQLQSDVLTEAVVLAQEEDKLYAATAAQGKLNDQIMKLMVAFGHRIWGRSSKDTMSLSYFRSEDRTT